MMKKRDGRQDDIQNKIPPINKILKEKPFSPANPDAVKKWWNNTNKNPEICTISWLRPQDKKGSHRKASGHWAKKATFRAEHWTSNRDETIWIDEIADANGRICLITGKLDILKWLEPEGYIETLLVKPPDSDHNFDSKTPSFARIRRVWETTKIFWDDVNQDFNTIIDPISIRLRITGIFKQKNGNISSNNAYEAELNGIRFSIFYTTDDDYFIIENLHRLAQKLGTSSQQSMDYCSSATFVKDQLHAKTIKIYDSEGKYRINILGYLTLSQIEPEFISYVPVIPIISEPSTFMAIVPADKAIKIARHIKEKYEKEMGKVRNRLPINLGLVFAKSHTPLPALMDAGRRMLEVSNKEENWTLMEDSHDCGVNCTLKFDNKITWHVPIKMGDGKTDDIWYPNFYVDGVPDNRSSAFEYPEGRWLFLVNKLKKDYKVKITPSRFDFEFLDSASRRFEVSYNMEGKRRDIAKSERPYLLEELDDFERLWNILSEGMSRTQIKNIIGRIEAKPEESSPSERNNVVECFVHDVLHNANWKNGKPSEIGEMEYAAFRGKLRDVVELYMDILKTKDVDD
ncbi:MAG: CRISPR-associated protein Csx11 [ANME-2 cluster archaeon]|nr:MAG: CRISPR-associated protein Csx11 [ANME-2 cluster archaeon]